MLLTLILTACTAAEYTSKDGSFTIPVPEGWRVRTAEILGQPMTIVEPNNGGEDRVVVGGGVALATNIQELAQHASMLAGQFLPGARLVAAPRFREHGLSAAPVAEQSYRNASLSAWNGMLLAQQGEFYFAVFAVGRTGREALLEQVGRTMLDGAKFRGIPRNHAMERALVGRWLNTDNRSHRTGVRDKLNSISNWSVILAPDGSFRSEKEMWVDTTSEVYGGGNTNAAAVASGSYRIYGNILVADFAGGAGKQLFTVELYPNGAGVKWNGQLFTRQ